MVGVISVPAEWVEDVSGLSFPPKTDKRMQDLMHRNNEGKLSANELEELAALVEMSERLSLVRADALRLLQRSPK
jgi:hypothetical protein